MIGKETPLDDLAKQLRADLVRVYGPGDGQSSSVSAVSICRKPAIVFDRIKPSPRGLLTSMQVTAISVLPRKSWLKLPFS